MSAQPTPSGEMDPDLPAVAQDLVRGLRDELERLRQHNQSLVAQAEASSEQARQYQHLLAEVPVALLRLDHQGRILSGNREAERLLGEPFGPKLGTHLFLCGATEADRQRLLQSIQLGCCRNRYLSLSHRCSFQGQPRMVDLHMSRVPAIEGRAAEWLVSLVDQTQVALEQAQLREAMDELRHALALNRDLAAVADRSPNLVAICQADERVLWANPRFLEITGWPIERLRESPLLPLLLGEAAQASGQVAALRQRWDDGLGQQRQRLNLHKADGQTLWADINLLTVQEGGAIVRRILIADDITEEVRLQAEQAAVLQQQALHQVQGEFLSRMSHNMRTPLNAILGFSQLLMINAATVLGDEDRQRLRILNDAGQQLLHMVDQALTLVRMEHLAQALEIAPVDLSTVARDVQLLTAEQAAAKGITTYFDVPDGCWVAGQVQLVQEILSNLVVNAIKYSPSGRRVDVRVRSDSLAWVALDVCDQGIGIADEDLARLFKPFTRLTHGSQMATGHGLGLAISQQQAQHMGGRIEVRSVLGQGSTFSLLLKPSQAADARSPAPSGLSVSPNDVPPMRLVYVEDDLINQILVADALSLCPQVQLHLAGTLAEGRELIAQLRPDVVLLDINLPDGLGTTLCRELCADPAHRPGMILASSADALPEHVAGAMAAGFDHFLPKPMAFDELFAWLSKAPRRP